MHTASPDSSRLVLRRACVWAMLAQIDMGHVVMVITVGSLRSFLMVLLESVLSMPTTLLITRRSRNLARSITCSGTGERRRF